MAKGAAMDEQNSLVKVILEEETGRILGATVVGSGASELVQQVVYLMNTELQDLRPVTRSQVIHPTINEVLVKAFSELQRPSAPDQDQWLIAREFIKCSRAE
jgi:pyruvate/2-oxoglutarate dehydrogenase complex dihydrolipoamide dehydrogenase (E3) component